MPQESQRWWQLGLCPCEELTGESLLKVIAWESGVASMQLGMGLLANSMPGWLAGSSAREGPGVWAAAGRAGCCVGPPWQHAADL